MTGPAKAALLSILLASSALAAEPAPPVSPETAAPRFGPWGYDLSSGDPSVAPGDDFDRYASGRWLDQAVIPVDRPAWSLSIANEARIEEELQAIVAAVAGDPDATDDAVRMATLFASFMDEPRVERLGASPLATRLSAIRAADDHEDIARLMGVSSTGFGVSLFKVEPLPDPFDPDRMIAAISHDGLGMPDRAYYLADGFGPTRVAYAAYVTRLLSLAGWTDPQRTAECVIAFETEIARRHWPAADRQDFEKTVNMMTASQLRTLAPGLPWESWFSGAGVSPDGRLLIAEKSAFRGLAALYRSTPVDTLQAWQAFHLIDDAAPYLSTAFVDAHFAFRGQALSGMVENRARSGRGLALVDETLGEALGKEYVRRHFPASSKREVEQLVRNLLAAMRLRIGNAAWMDEATRAEALKKVDSFRVKIGYPNTWRSYHGLEVRSDDLYGNVLRARAFEWNFRRDQIGKPVDKALWHMTPQTMNAYYDPPSNEIVFPAAMLQAPRFDPRADPAINYGGIGMIIGHEIVHGFDDQGRKTDWRGVFRDWWTAADAARFDARIAVLRKQFDAEQPLPGYPIDGTLTLGENIADLSGLLLALDAYRLSLNGQPAPVLDGFTGEQRFFLAHAQAWRKKMRDAALKQTLTTDSHAPNRWRVFMPLRNIDAWYDAFAVQPGQTLYLAPKDRAVIW